MSEALIVNGRPFAAHTCGNPRSVRVVDDELRFDLRPGDVWTPTPGAERAELCSVEKLNAFTVEFDMLVEAGPNTAGWLVLGQYHQKDSPTVAIELSGEKLRIVGRDKTRYMRLFEGAFARDRWYWFKLEIKPGSGIKVWIDGKSLPSYSGPLGWPGLSGNWKAGIYRAPAPEIMVSRVRNLLISPDK